MILHQYKVAIATNQIQYYTDVTAYSWFGTDTFSLNQISLGQKLPLFLMIKANQNSTLLQMNSAEIVLDRCYRVGASFDIYTQLGSIDLSTANIKIAYKKRVIDQVALLNINMLPYCEILV